MALLAQFPLQSVLLPGMPLHLQIFEPRYVNLLEDVAVDDGDDGRFGVVLITRGSEVGGDDQRAEVGTVARITGKQLMPDGRWLVEAEGTERYRIIEWLPDDPYPRAVVEVWPATLGDDGAELLSTLIPNFEQFLLLASELGADVSGLGAIESSMDGIYRMARILPLTAYDRYGVLAATSGAESVGRLGDALAGAIELVRHQLDEGDS